MTLFSGRARARLALLTTLAVTTGLLVAPGVGTPVADAGTTSAHPKTLTVLVIPAFWDKNIDDRATLRTTFARAGAFWAAQSRGRFAMAATVTTPVKVARGCDDVARRARAAAAKLGYHLGHYGLVVTLAPTCARVNGVDHLDESRSSTGQRLLTLYGAPRREVRSVIRALGRGALGLGPSERWLCRHGSTPVTDGRRTDCFAVRSDQDVDIDPLSDGARAGNLSAPGLSVLHWLGHGDQRTLSHGTTSLTLRPLGTSGLRAVRISVSRDLSYWLEYRSGAGADAGMPASERGVLIRRLERNPAGLDGDAYRPAVLAIRPTTQLSGPLLGGESWTTPQRIRISVGTQTAAGVHVTVRFGAPQPTRPAPVSVSVTPGRTTMDAHWTRSPDRGLPIDYYELAVLDRHGVELARYLSHAITARLDHLTTAYAFGHYTVRVRVHTEAGNSAWAAAGFDLTAPVPLVRLTLPPDGATVTGRYLDLAAWPVVNVLHDAPRSVWFETSFGGLGTATRGSDGVWRLRADLSRTPAGGMDVWASVLGSDGVWRNVGAGVINVPDHVGAPTINQVSPDGPWAGGTLTVQVAPGVEHLSGASTDGVIVRIGSVSRTARADNDWTVTFERSEITPDAHGNPPSVVEARSFFGGPENYSSAVDHSLMIT